MVMCDYCANFYHPDCIGRTVAECEELNTLKCPTCESHGIDDPIYTEGKV